jgi:hypothetical protein
MPPLLHSRFIFHPFPSQTHFRGNTTAPHLILSILCLAYQHGEDPECSNQAGSGAILSTRCFNKARSIIAFDNNMLNDPTQSLAIVQSYLLLQICAMMYMCGDHSANGLKMHSNMISLARSAGLMQPFAASSLATEDLDSLWHEFIQGETRKQTLFTVHQIDALWYQLLSIPRSIST